MLPDNVTAIVSFLLSNGYTRNAAAGIAGNIYQESKGDPEAIGSGGGGLIGWTPLRSGIVTGNPAADLRTQLAAILTCNNGWSAYLPALERRGHARRRRLHVRHGLRARGHPRREHPRSLRGRRRGRLRHLTC